MGVLECLCLRGSVKTEPQSAEVSRRCRSIAPPMLETACSSPCSAAISNTTPVRVLNLDSRPWRCAAPQDQPLLSDLSPDCLTPLAWLGEGTYGCVELCRVSVPLLSPRHGDPHSPGAHARAARSGTDQLSPTAAAETAGLEALPAHSDCGLLVEAPASPSPQPPQPARPHAFNCPAPARWSVPTPLDLALLPSSSSAAHPARSQSAQPQPRAPPCPSAPVSGADAACPARHTPRAASAPRGTLPAAPDAAAAAAAAAHPSAAFSAAAGAPPSCTPRCASAPSAVRCQHHQQQVQPQMPELVVAVKKVDYHEPARHGQGRGRGPSRTRLSRMQAIEMLQLSRCRDCPFIVRLFGCVPAEAAARSSAPASGDGATPRAGAAAAAARTGSASVSSPPQSCRIVMEWAEGGDLGSLVHALSARRGPCVDPLREPLLMSEASARFYLACLLEALAFLHGRSLMHRDVKPSNLLLASDGRAKLGDLGMVCHLDSRGRAAGRAGTPNYMAPEVWAYGTKTKYDSYAANADLWSAGCLLHELLTGHLPAPHPDEYLHPGWRLHSSAMHPAFSPELRDLLRRLLTVKPRRRLQSVAEVVAHPWFRGFGWAALRDGSLAPPYVPADHRPGPQPPLSLDRERSLRPVLEEAGACGPSSAGASGAPRAARGASAGSAGGGASLLGRCSSSLRSKSAARSTGAAGIVGSLRGERAEGPGSELDPTLGASGPTEPSVHTTFSAAWAGCTASLLLPARSGGPVSPQPARRSRADSLPSVCEQAACEDACTDGAAAPRRPGDDRSASGLSALTAALASVLAPAARHHPHHQRTRTTSSLLPQRSALSLTVGTQRCGPPPPELAVGPGGASHSSLNASVLSYASTLGLGAGGERDTPSTTATAGGSAWWPPSEASGSCKQGALPPREASTLAQSLSSFSSTTWQGVGAAASDVGHRARALASAAMCLPLLMARGSSGVGAGGGSGGDGDGDGGARAARRAAHLWLQRRVEAAADAAANAGASVQALAAAVARLVGQERPAQGGDKLACAAGAVASGDGLRDHPPAAVHTPETADSTARLATTGAAASAAGPAAAAGDVSDAMGSLAHRVLPTHVDALAPGPHGVDAAGSVVVVVQRSGRAQQALEQVELGPKRAPPPPALLDPCTVAAGGAEAPTAAVGGCYGSPQGCCVLSQPSRPPCTPVPGALGGHCRLDSFSFNRDELFLQQQRYGDSPAMFGAECGGVKARLMAPVIEEGGPSALAVLSEPHNCRELCASGQGWRAQGLALCVLLLAAAMVAGWGIAAGSPRFV